MKFLIVSQIVHRVHNGEIWAYGPYIREMNLWEKYVDDLYIIAPKVNDMPLSIDLKYNSKRIYFIDVPQLSTIGLKNFISSILNVPVISIKILKYMNVVDHIHLRCPGNMGLLGSLLQIFFSKKIKTAKYAGNWDWNSIQPWTYRLQQRILRNTFFTKNMKVLVYGEWPDKTNNIKSFFTASYNEIDKLPINKTSLNTRINLIYVGTLSANKRPMISVEVLHKLILKNKKVNLIFCGEGSERTIIQNYVNQNNLNDFVTILGNVRSEIVVKYLQESHFLVFMSKSEGWPKAVAEAMWWGCIPITTSVSCVPQMLDYGKRGLICDPDSNFIVKEIIDLLNNEEKLNNIRLNAIDWSRQFTLEVFENDIKSFLNK